MRKDRPIKIPYYWFDAGIRLMSDTEAGQFFDMIISYGFHGILPDVNQMTDRQKELWPICKRDLDYQKVSPHSYRYPEDERIAIRRSKEYRAWRNDVFKRDGYTCQICGRYGGTLNAHHIKPFSRYPNDRLNVDNGITLCIGCHKAVHKGLIKLVEE